jgi:hypothetical protein
MIKSVFDKEVGVCDICVLAYLSVWVIVVCVILATVTILLKVLLKCMKYLMLSGFLFTVKIRASSVSSQTLEFCY